MNCDPNALAQAATCFQCGLLDDTLSAAKTALLCSWLGASAPALPAGLTNDLLLRNESLSFDSYSDGQAITSWPDLSGNGHHWTIITALAADRTRMLGTHPSVRFNGTTSICQQPFFFPAGTGFAGLTMMGILREDLDPPTLGALMEGSLATFNHPIAFPPHQPFSDSNFYEGFGRTDRPSLGNPAMSMTTARIYTVVAPNPGSAYNVWLRGGGVTEQVFAGGAFTFQQQGLEITAPANVGGPNYSMGNGYQYDNQSVHRLLGNIGALFVWKRALSDSDRLAMWGYLETNYAV